MFRPSKIQSLVPQPRENLVQTKPRKRFPLVLTVFLALIVALIALEGLTRIVVKKQRWLNPDYVAISSGFSDLDTLIDDQYRHPGLMYYDEFLYAAKPYESTYINFTDYYSARLTPDSVPLQEAEHIVWAFGGSTMENTETTDHLTIANTWARKFNSEIGPTHVKNLGTGSFSSTYELIKFQKLLREVPQNELPSIAIFYDGFNDTLNGYQYGPGNLQKDLSLKLMALVEHNDLTLMIYTTSRLFSKYSFFWERTFARLFEYMLFPLPEPDGGNTNFEATVKAYSSNLKMAQATCEVYDVQCFFILQPLIVTKNPLTELEQKPLSKLEDHPRFGSQGTKFIRGFYERISQEFSDADYFIDASHILDGRTQDDFYDLGHVGATTPPIIGEITADLILSRLKGMDASLDPSE